jgi:hypothetical protein
MADMQSDFFQGDMIWANSIDPTIARKHSCPNMESNLNADHEGQSKTFIKVLIIK